MTKAFSASCMLHCLLIALILEKIDGKPFDRQDFSEPVTYLYGFY